MSLPTDTELLPPSGATTRLPSLGSPELSVEYLRRIKEILEAMLGRRGGNDWDRVVTFRDLHQLGLEAGSAGGIWFNMGAVAPDPSSPAFQQLAGRLSAEVMNSAAYKKLATRIGSAEDMAHLPDEIKRQLSLGLSQAARERQAAIQTVEEKIQTTRLSLASRLNEITASLEQTAAGVRHFDAAYADKTKALALQITELSASLEGIGAVSIQEQFEAIASAIDGLKGQWSVKIQAGTEDNPIMAGIGLSVEDPIEGPATRAFVILADIFSFYTEIGAIQPFIATASGLEINGLLRVNGTPIQEIGQNYMWRKYGTNAQGAGLTDNPDNMAYIGLAFNKPSATASTDPLDYTWSLMRGTDGQPIKGDPGVNGIQYWTWIAYSDNPDGTGLYQQPTDTTQYIGIGANKTSETESTNKLDYVWSKFRGPQGAQGQTGQTGARGTVEIAVPTTGSIWSSVEAANGLAARGFGAPRYLDRVTLYNQTTKFSEIRFFEGTAWLPMAAFINGNMLVDGTVAAQKIIANGLILRGAAGNALVGDGVPLDPSLAAAGTKNSEIVIGGRNLVLDSGFERGTRTFPARSGISSVLDGGTIGTVGAYAGSKSLFFDSQSGTEAYLYLDGAKPKVIPGQTYSLSFHYRTGGQVTGTSTFWIARAANGTQVGSITFPLAALVASGSAWTREVVQWLCPTGVDYIEQRFGYLSGGGYAWMAVDCIQVEEGNKATAWTPAPEDTAADTAAAQAAADAANAALPGISTAIADKLSKTSASALAATITLQSNGTLLAGTPDNGVYMTPIGIYCVQGGVIRVAIPISGDPTFAGKLLAAFGTFGAVSIAADGSLQVGNRTWDTGSGVWFGFHAGVAKLAVGVAGGAELKWDGVELKMSAARVAAPVLDSFSNTVAPGSISTGGANGEYTYGTLTASGFGGSGAYSHNWTLTKTSVAGTVRLNTTTGASVAVIGTASNATVTCEATCTTTDSSGRSDAFTVMISANHGTPP